VVSTEASGNDRVFSKFFSGSGLTRKQRSLVVIVIILLCYIAFGSLVNSFLIHLGFVDALYFTVATIETIGFGDITPKSTDARIFVCIDACLGILNLGLAVAMTQETVLEALQVAYRKRLKALRERRRAARRRRRIEQRWREAVEWRLREARSPIWVKNSFKTGVLGYISWFLDRVNNFLFWRWHLHGSSRETHYGYGYHPHGKHLNIEALSRADLEAAALEAGVPLHMLIPAWLRFRSRESSRESINNPDTTHVGDVLIGGITGLWREKRSRDEREQACQTMPLTHVHISRMAGMIRNLAFAIHASSSQAERTSDTRDGLPVSPGDMEKDAGNNTSEISNADTASLAKNAQNVEESPATPRVRPSSQEVQVNLSPLLARIVSPVNNISKVDVSLDPQKDEAGKISLASEERKAFYAQVTVAWLLFLVFWAVGSAIFSRTEGWSYGVAMYFCGWPTLVSFGYI
jgi:potassium channel subfamily K